MLRRRIGGNKRKMPIKNHKKEILIEKSYLNKVIHFKENNMAFLQDFKFKKDIPQNVNFMVVEICIDFKNKRTARLIGFNHGLSTNQTKSYGNGCILIEYDLLKYSVPKPISINDSNINKYVSFIGDSKNLNFSNIKGLFKIIDSDCVSYYLKYVGDPLEHHYPTSEFQVDKELLKQYLDKKTIEPIEFIANNLDGLKDALKNDDIFYFYRNVICTMMDDYGEIVLKNGTIHF